MRRKQNPEITKPYRVPINIDNKPLPYKSHTTHARILLPDKPLYDGDVVSQKNPFTITCYGDTEFGLMKLVRHEWPSSQVLEIKNV